MNFIRSFVSKVKGLLWPPAPTNPDDMICTFDPSWKSYDEDYKAAYRKYSKALVTCPCGAVVQYNYLRDHMSTPKHKRVIPDEPKGIRYVYSLDYLVKYKIPGFYGPRKPKPIVE